MLYPVTHDFGGDVSQGWGHSFHVGETHPVCPQVGLEGRNEPLKRRTPAWITTAMSHQDKTWRL